MTNSHPQVSVLTIRHLDQVLAINNANVPAVSELTAHEFEFDLEHSLYALMITDESGDELRAFCVTFAPGAPYQSSNYKWFSDRYEGFVYLDRIAVSSQHQNKGYGVAIYRALEQLMIRDGVTPVLTCEVNLQPPNPGSLRFHHRLGFSEVGRHESKPGIIVSMLAKSIY
ncbi:MAG: GNAT family N-acetyltransferase [Ilumatobacteraceae bacterium]